MHKVLVARCKTLVIKNFYGLQVYLIVHVKLNNDPITHVIPVMRCYATWKHWKNFMFSDVFRGCIIVWTPLF